MRKVVNLTEIHTKEFKTCIVCHDKLPATIDFFNYSSKKNLRKFTFTCSACLAIKDLPSISDEQAEFYQKVANSLATKHIIKLKTT